MLRAIDQPHEKKGIPNFIYFDRSVGIFFRSSNWQIEENTPASKTNGYETFYLREIYNHRIDVLCSAGVFFASLVRASRD